MVESIRRNYREREEGERKERKEMRQEVSEWVPVSQQSLHDSEMEREGEAIDLGEMMVHLCGAEELGLERM